MNRQERFDYLYTRMSDHKYLNRTETGDELPFYICPYPPKEKFAIIEDTQLLKNKLAQKRITVLECIWQHRSGTYQKYNHSDTLYSAKRNMDWTADNKTQGKL